MARCITLFAYGTLQPQCETAAAWWLSRRLVESHPATVPGRLFAIPDRDGWFPALLPARSASRVHGTLCIVRLAPGERAWLDGYEGCDYSRTGLPASGLGRRYAAQVYRWRAPLPPAARFISGGSFLDWLRDNRCDAYAMDQHGR